MTNDRRIFPVLDWRWINMGARGFDTAGNDFVAEAPLGVKIEAEPAEKSESVLAQDKPWEKPIMTFAQVFKDENGAFRMWYRTGAGLCYADSNDGFNWRRPELGLSEYEGSRANNICAHEGHWIEAPGIMVDPSCSEEERYKMIYFSGRWENAQGNEITEEQGVTRNREVRQAWLEGKDAEMDVRCRTGMYGAVSPDGLRWRELPEPLCATHCDSQNIPAYDSVGKRYFGFIRSHGPRGRSIGYSETCDFRNWPEPAVVLHTDNDDPPDVDLYTSCYTPYPGVQDLHVMFPAVYRHVEDRVDVRMAVCSNFRDWQWVDRRVAIPYGVPGSVDAGAVYACPNLVRMPDGRMGLMCCAASRRHNDAFLMPKVNGRWSYQWALWERDRLAGISAEDEGSFTVGLPVTGGSIHVNCRTAPGGWINAELINGVSYPPRPTSAISGYSFDECEPVTGDVYDGPLRWKTHETLPEGMKKALVRVHMKKAKIFAFMV